MDTSFKDITATIFRQLLILFILERFYSSKIVLQKLIYLLHLSFRTKIILYINEHFLVEIYCSYEGSLLFWGKSKKWTSLQTFFRNFDQRSKIIQSICVAYSKLILYNNGIQNYHGRSSDIDNSKNPVCTRIFVGRIYVIDVTRIHIGQQTSDWFEYAGSYSFIWISGF